MPLEGFGSPVVVVSTDLAVVVDVQPVQFIEPVWNGLEGIKQGNLKKQKIKQNITLMTSQRQAT